MTTLRPITKPTAKQIETLKRKLRRALRRAQKGPAR